MKYTSFAQLFREKTVGQNDSTAVPASTITLYANLAKDRLARQIITSVSNGMDKFVINLTTDLIENQREYPFPNDVLKNIKVVQAYIGGKWRRLYPFDINSYRLYDTTNQPYSGRKPTESFSGATDDETTITEQFTDTFPMFDIDGGSIVIFSNSIDAVTGGLKLKAFIYPADYEDANWTNTNDMSIATTSTSTAMHRQSHDVLLMRAVIEYKESKGVPLTPFEVDYFNEEQRMIDSLSNINEDDSFESITPVDTGYDY